MLDIQPITSWRFPADACRFDSAPAVASPYTRWNYRLGTARQILRCQRREHGATLFAVDRGTRDVVTHWDDPIDALRWLGGQVWDCPYDLSAPPFKGGWAGFIGYEAGGLFETLPATARDDLDVPLFEFQSVESLDACDSSGRMLALDLRRDTERMTANPSRKSFGGESPLISNFSPEQYMRAVAWVIEYIRAGDVFQVNLSQRFTVGLGSRTPSEIYQRLLDRHPAWYGALFQSEGYSLLCNSPELFLRVQPGATGRKIITRPIKGTRPLGEGMREALAGSAKDQAELNMIVDLERNDLGRVCKVGSIRVAEPRVIEQHPTVYHGAATVEGTLREDVGFVDLLRATFPGGSVTGAPKIRAMQIIDELEPVRRGPYCGAIGYLSADGNIELNVAIRTMIVERGRVHIPVGGGIVADSDPQAEYDETLVKAKAMFAALGVSM